MDMIEILGSLLGQKASGSGTGADILKDILVGGSRGAAPEAAPRSAPHPTPTPAPRGSAADDLEQQARELEDLLNVATGRSASRQTQAQTPQMQPPARHPQALPRQPAEAPRQGGSWQDSSAGKRQDSPLDDAAARQNEQATILIRAMVNAAKCDGEISPTEQQAILGQLSNPSSAAIEFLREEFGKPFDVREFAWSVPVGMEQQVYSMSLIAIDVDSDREQTYLRDLARGLRLKPEVCEQIKERLTGSGLRLATAR